MGWAYFMKRGFMVVYIHVFPPFFCTTIIWVLLFYVQNMYILIKRYRPILSSPEL